MAKQAIPKTALAPTLSAESEAATLGRGIAHVTAGNLQKSPQPVGADGPADELWRDGSLDRSFELREHAGPASETNSPMRSRRPSVPSADSSTSFDRLLHAQFARLTLGVSPFALWLAYADWAIHLWAAPGKRQQLIEAWARKAINFSRTRRS